LGWGNHYPPQLAIYFFVAAHTKASQQPFAVVATSAGFRAGYDRNGNMLARVEMSGTQVITYVQEWTVENRLAVVTNTVTGDATRFVYDGDGNRIARQDPTGLTVNVGAVEVEISGTQRLTTTYYFAGGQRIAMRKDGKVTYLHGDHLGSASLATDASGARVSAMRYTPFGETRVGDAPTDRRFTGQRQEAGIGLYDYGARFYSSGLGRFVSADSIIPDPKNPQALNRYSYVLNNPLRFNDPTGHFYGPDPYDPAGFENMDEAYAYAKMTGNSAFLDQYKPNKYPHFVVPPLNPSSITGSPKNGFGNTRVAFQHRNDWYRGLGGLHSGIDIGAPNGTPLVAMDYGTIVCAGDGCFMGSGNKGIAIKTGNYVVVYGHVQDIKVSPGDIVKPGMTVAQVGDDHLHLEVRQMKRGADPANRHDSFCNPLYFFAPTVSLEMGLTWQSYVDRQGNLSSNYNQWSMMSYMRPGNWFSGTLKSVIWTSNED